VNIGCIFCDVQDDKRGKPRVVFWPPLTLCLLLVAGTLLFAPGCGQRGPKLAPVSGVVTIDGKPLTGGFIRLVSEDGRPSGGRIGHDGRFTLGCFTKDDGCVIGKHKVEVHGFENLSGTKRKWLAPRTYASTGSSGLTVTIDGPNDGLKIDLTWTGSPAMAPFVEESPAEFRGGKRLDPKAADNSR
jgi:hypothetical protein